MCCLEVWYVWDALVMPVGQRASVHEGADKGAAPVVAWATGSSCYWADASFGPSGSRADSAVAPGSP